MYDEMPTAGTTGRYGPDYFWTSAPHWQDCWLSNTTMPIAHSTSRKASRTNGMSSTRRIRRGHVYPQAPVCAVCLSRFNKAANAVCELAIASDTPDVM